MTIAEDGCCFHLNISRWTSIACRASSACCELRVAMSQVGIWPRNICHMSLLRSRSPFPPSLYTALSNKTSRKGPGQDCYITLHYALFSRDCYPKQCTKGATALGRMHSSMDRRRVLVGIYLLTWRELCFCFKPHFGTALSFSRSSSFVSMCKGFPHAPKKGRMTRDTWPTQRSRF